MNDTIQSLMNFMASRLKLGDDLQSSSSSVRAFCNFTTTSEDIRAVWKFFPDVVLAMRTFRHCHLSQVIQDKCFVWSAHQSIHRYISTHIGVQATVNWLRTPDISIQSSKVVAEKQVGACDYRQLSVGLHPHKHTTIDIIRSSPSCAALNYRERGRSRDTPKASKQSWFSNVFGTAADDEEELEKTEKPIRRKFWL